MIETVTDSDIDEIRELIAKTVKTSVLSCEDEAAVLIEDIGSGLDRWLENKAESCHLKYVLEGKIVGVILIRNYWNLYTLFVLPSHYNKGIGKALFQAASSICREKPDISKIKVNSSHFAKGFYKAIGFVQTGPGLDRPGGCVPFEYDLKSVNTN